MSINGSQKALSCVESEKKKIKYTCAGNGSFLLTHTWELSLLSWDCNLSLIFCNASFSSLSLSRSDLSFLKSSSYIWTCNHHEHCVSFSRATLWFGCFLNTAQAEGWIPRGSLLPTILPTKVSLVFFCDWCKVTSNGHALVALINWSQNWNSPQCQFLYNLAHQKADWQISVSNIINEIANTSIHLFKGLAVGGQTFYPTFFQFSLQLWALLTPSCIPQVQGVREEPLQPSVEAEGSIMYTIPNGMECTQFPEEIQMFDPAPRK